MQFYSIEEVQEDLVELERKNFEIRNERKLNMVFTKLYSDFVVDETETEFMLLIKKYTDLYSLQEFDHPPEPGAFFTIYHHLSDEVPLIKVSDCKTESEFLETMQTAVECKKLVVLYNSGRIERYTRTQIH